MSVRSPVVTLYGRAGCHLCDDARTLLASVAAEGLEFELAEIDIESDDRLHLELLEVIPVIRVDGVVVAELEVDIAQLRKAIVGAASIPADGGHS